MESNSTMVSSWALRSMTALPAIRLDLVGALIPWLVLTFTGLAMASDTSPEVSTISRGTGVLESQMPARQGTELMASSQRLRYKAANGDAEQVHLVSVWDPKSGLFWRNYYYLLGSELAPDAIAQLANDSVFFVDDQGIFSLQKTSLPPKLWLLSSNARVESLEEGEAQALESLRRHPPSRSSQGAPEERTIELINDLPRDFFFNPKGSSLAAELEIKSIARVGSGWLIKLTGREDREALLELDKHLQLVSLEESL